MDRRDFLKTGAAIAGAALVPNVVGAGENPEKPEKPEKKPNTSERVKKEIERLETMDLPEVKIEFINPVFSKQLKELEESVGDPEKDYNPNLRAEFKGISIRTSRQINESGEIVFTNFVLGNATVQVIKLKGKHFLYRCYTSLEDFSDDTYQEKVDVKESLSRMRDFLKGDIREVIDEKIKNTNKQLNPETPVIEEFKAGYETAMRHFYEREFDYAIVVYNALLEQFPDHKLVSNCKYWVGECYYGKKDYSQAIQCFKEINNYEFSYKDDDAVWMLARSYRKLGDSDNAKKYCKKLLKEYPNSEFVDVVEDMLVRLEKNNNN